MPRQATLTVQQSAKLWLVELSHTNRPQPSALNAASTTEFQPTYVGRLCGLESARTRAYVGDKLRLVDTWRQGATEQYGEPMSLTLGEQLVGLDVCPHCRTSNPTLTLMWFSSGPTRRADGKKSFHWGSYACTTCGSVVTACASPDHRRGDTLEVDAFCPTVWSPHASLPAKVARYLQPASNTLGSPDASVVMSSSAIDAMLKDQGLSKGTLYERIDKAVGVGIITKTMSEWAHRVRLDANNPRHADEVTPHLTREDAARAFEFADALAQFLYVLPSHMPEEPQQDNS